MGDNRNPLLAEVIDQHVTAARESMRIAQPGRIESYDPTTLRADVTPLLRIPLHLSTGAIQWTKLTKLLNVPVLMPSAGGQRVRLPVTIGDIVLVVFCDFNLDTWKAGAGKSDPLGVVSPPTSGAHEVTGAVIIPGLLDPSSSPSINDAVSIHADGTVVLAGGAANVNRSGDVVSADAHMAAWIGNVSTALSITPPSDFGKTSGGNPNVKA